MSVLKLGNDCIENHKEFILLLMPSGVLDIVEVFLEIVMEILISYLHVLESIFYSYTNSQQSK